MPSPYRGRHLTVSEQIAISAFWFGTNFLWGALIVVLLPNEVAAIAPVYRVPAIGLLTALAAIIAIAVPLIVGALSDRCASNWGRRRPFIATGLAVNLAGLVLMYVAYATRHPLAHGNPGTEGTLIADAHLLAHGSFVLFLLAYMVVQLGNNIATAAYSGVIPDLVPKNQRGRASGYMALMSQAGTLFGAVGCGLLLEHAPEAIKYLVLCLFLTGAALVTIFGIKESALPSRPSRLEWGPYLKSLYINPKTYPDFAWVWITRALVMLGFYGILPFINYYFVDVIGIAQDHAGAVASELTGVILLTSSISGIYGGYISDQIGRKKVVYIANSMIAAMCVVFVFCRTINEVLLAGILFGLGFGAYTSVDWALGTDVLPTKSNAAKEMAVWHIAMTLPQTIGAPIAVFLIGAFGTVHATSADQVVHYPVAGYSALFIFAAVCFASGAYFLKNVRGAR